MTYDALSADLKTRLKYLYADPTGWRWDTKWILTLGDTSEEDDDYSCVALVPVAHGVPIRQAVSPDHPEWCIEFASRACPVIHAFADLSKTKKILDSLLREPAPEIPIS